MVITYRRTGGLFMLLTLAAAALAATVLTVAVAGTLLIVSAASFDLSKRLFRAFRSASTFRSSPS